MTSTMMKKAVRLRMARTGEKYTRALRALQADPGEFERLAAELRRLATRRRYPFTGQDGLDRHHVLSAFETQRRAH
jgi:hypothetical protein